MKQGDSPVWKDLLKVKQIYLQGRIMVVGDGRSTDFWHDTWGKMFPSVNNTPPCMIFALIKSIQSGRWLTVDGILSLEDGLMLHYKGNWVD